MSCFSFASDVWIVPTTAYTTAQRPLGPPKLYRPSTDGATGTVDKYAEAGGGLDRDVRSGLDEDARES